MLVFAWSKLLVISLGTSMLLVLLFGIWVIQIIYYYIHLYTVCDFLTIQHYCILLLNPHFRKKYDIKERTTAQKMKIFSKDFSKSFLRIWSHLLKKSLIEDFIFCSVNITQLNAKINKKLMNSSTNSFLKKKLFWCVQFRTVELTTTRIKDVQELKCVWQFLA